ncbi:hypothetical protein FHETE_1147 [Fusarium heterosporum]|uniref:Uncharacterized protein n=1 Tax=Fusarium heterosporum TaxID=42747 RepID=A0A8H5X0C4_FUSHE|nr:hypothetical protein FHETE_1147 [Fusarium heterosporum]
MCTYTHQFTKCENCMDILYEDNPVTQRCAAVKKGKTCTGRYQEEKDTIYVSKKNCENCIQREAKKKAKK